MRVCVIGTGYVGLVTGPCLSDLGHHVVCVDKDVQKIENLNKNIVPIYEPSLEELITQCVKADRLSFTTSLKTGMAGSDVIIIAVGTPPCEETGQADLKYIEQAAAEIAENIDGYCVVTTKSTVPVGTSDKVASIIERVRPDLKRGVDFDVASNPEFLREGSAISDFMKPDRIAVGVETERAQKMLQILYKPLTDMGYPLICTDIKSAELSKYAANGFLSIKLGFINEIADLCENLKANVDDVAKITGLDNRIGSQFFKTGPGYGGSCFPKDTLALSKIGHTYNSPVTLVDQVIIANGDRKKKMADKVIETLGGQCHGQKVAILGLTFKANTDDLRESPSLAVLSHLKGNDLNIYAYDPFYNAKNPSKIVSKIYPEVTLSESIDDCVTDADIAVILTEWNEFKIMNLGHIRDLMNPGATLLDLRNLYDYDTTEITYKSLGRPSVS